MTLLSIVVPIRDMSGRLDPLFEWVKTALEDEFEVVLVHDYADSTTELELTSFVKTQSANKLVFLSGSFNSPGLARNEGMARVSGDFVAFWDSDDLPDVEEMLLLAQQCKDSDYEIGIGGFLTLDEDNHVLNAFPTSSQSSIEKIAMYPGLWRMVFKTSILANVRFSNLLLAEDQLFLAMTHPTERKTLFSDRIVYRYKVKQKGALTTIKQNTRDLVKALQKFTFLLQDQKYKSDLRFILILVVKNSLTVMKAGNNQDRLKVLILFNKVALRYLPSVVGILAAVVNFKRNVKFK
jgi:glycosyltransferase involved in cell wall biosynthesis